MIRRNAVIGIGFVFLVIGLAGLVLLQTEVIYPPASKGQIGSIEAEPGGSSGQAGLERRKLPGPPESPNQTPEPAGQTDQSQPPASQSREGLPTPSTNADTAGESGAMIPHPAEREGGEQPPSSALPGTEKPIPAPQAGTGESLYSRQDQPGQPGTTSRGTEATRKPSPKALEPVVIRFRFDPAAKREINVARVHFGDSVSVKVRRFGQADLRLYLAFAVPNIVQTRAWQGWSAGTRREVTAPILDTDRISLTADGYFGTALTKELDSKEGAVLKLGADYPPGRGSLFQPPRQGSYEIEIRIYPGNRWNIRPRSLV